MKRVLKKVTAALLAATMVVGLACNNYEQTMNYLCTFLHFLHTFFIMQYNFLFYTYLYCFYQTAN